METAEFQADTTKLLDLVVNSLYTERDVFLRELITNASDALDRFRIEALMAGRLPDDGAPLEIHLSVSPSARTLTVSDNGIGMGRHDVVQYLGTIARSGTRETAATGRTLAAADFIGQFGVGFYSCFKVADRVTVITRRDDDTVGTRWESHGVADYTIDDVADCQRGTAVTLELKPKDAEIGIEDYTERVVLERVVRRYTDFISYPIVYVGPDSVVDSSGQRTERADARIILNSQRPIWTRPEQEVTAQEYTEFYHHITNDWTEPLLRMSLKAEGRWEYSSLLFVPAQAPSDLFYHDARFGLQLYSNRILLVDECSDLIPRYLRFVKGVVDAADVPLNVSRQALQHPEHLVRIRRWLTRRVLDTIATLKSKDALKFSTLWQQFGRVLKEGIAEDHENRDRLLSFSMFRSSMSDEPTTLGAYVSRMKSEQLHIYYLTGQTRQVIEASPHKEQCRKLGYEVLYLDEPVDELVVQAVPHYNSHALKSVATFR